MLPDKQTIKKDFCNKLMDLYAEEVEDSSTVHQYKALGVLIKSYLSKSWMETNKQYTHKNKKQVYYFSLEFLIGKMLESYLNNLGIKEQTEEALKELNIDLSDLINIERDAGLGNGGLGRLAACFLDSMASLEIPGHGCGIRYKYGLFEQKIVDGCQVEVPDKWLKYGNIWEVRKRNRAVKVRFGGNVYMTLENGKLNPIHENYEEILAVPYDMPIIGYHNNSVNTLRLWSAEPLDNEFDFLTFSHGEYLKAVEYKYSVESITQVLYPDDSTEKGKLLRLKQQYFFVSAGIQSIIRQYKKMNKSLYELDKYIAIQINDTHPVVGIAELMRILVDEENMSWDDAWKITISTFAYTNHTILAEASEKWDVDMFSKLLPRIYMIIEEINRRFCAELINSYNGDWNKINNMSIIQNGYIKMANLAIVGSHSVNGVAALHTEILKKKELSNFHNFYPGKFNNKTNGITHRRWLMQANPKLADLITKTIGDRWIKEPVYLNEFAKYATNPQVKEAVRQIKLDNKIGFSEFVKDKYDIVLNPNSIFDVQAKRLHAYKRQSLNIFHVIHLYNKLLENPSLDIQPRTFIFAAKAFPGYTLAKQIIKLINCAANKINNDPIINGKIKVVFVENYGVSLAEKLIPCADVSEQISTASKEASGTGNMKFMMNGAITIATLDGANIEIKDAVGEDNIVTFGLTAKQVLDYYKNKNYNAIDLYHQNKDIKKILDQLSNGFFDVPASEFTLIRTSLLRDNDEFFVLKDFEDYIHAQNKIDKLYRNDSLWQEMCIHNIAHSGRFSSDNTILNYSKEIWNTEQVEIQVK